MNRLRLIGESLQRTVDGTRRNGDTETPSGVYVLENPSLAQSFKALLSEVADKVYVKAVGSARTMSSVYALDALRFASSQPEFPPEKFMSLLSALLPQSKEALVRGSLGCSPAMRMAPYSWIAVLRALAHVAMLPDLNDLAAGLSESARVILLRELQSYMLTPTNTLWPLAGLDTDWLAAEVAESASSGFGFATDPALLPVIGVAVDCFARQTNVDMAALASLLKSLPEAEAHYHELVRGDWVMDAVVNFLLRAGSMQSASRLLSGKRLQIDTATAIHMVEIEVDDPGAGPLSLLSEHLPAVAYALTREIKQLNDISDGMVALPWPVAHGLLSGFAAAFRNDPKNQIKASALGGFAVSGFLGNDMPMAPELPRPLGDDLVNYMAYRAGDSSEADGLHRIESLGLCAKRLSAVPLWTHRLFPEVDGLDSVLSDKTIDVDVDICSEIMLRLEDLGVYDGDRQELLLTRLLLETDPLHHWRFECWDRLAIDSIEWTARLAHAALRAEAERSGRAGLLAHVVAHGEVPLAEFCRVLCSGLKSPVLSEATDADGRALPGSTAHSIGRGIFAGGECDDDSLMPGSALGFAGSTEPAVAKAPRPDTGALVDAYVAFWAFRPIDKDAVSASHRLTLVLQRNWPEALERASRIPWMQVPFVSHENLGLKPGTRLTPSWMLDAVGLHSRLSVPACAEPGALLLPVLRRESLFWNPSHAAPGSVRSTFYYFAPESPVALALGNFRVFRSKRRAFLALWREVLAEPTLATVVVLDTSNTYGHPKMHIASANHPRFIRSRRQLRLRARRCPAPAPGTPRKRGKPWIAPDSRVSVTEAELDADTDTDCGNSDLEEEELNTIYNTLSAVPRWRVVLDDTVDNRIGALCRLLKVDTVLFQQVNPHNGSEILDARSDSRRSLCAIDGPRMGGLLPEVYSGTSGVKQDRSSSQPLLWTPDVGVLWQEMPGKVGHSPVEVQRFTGEVRFVPGSSVPIKVVKTEDQEQGIPADIMRATYPTAGLYLPAIYDDHTGFLVVDLRGVATQALFMGHDCCVHIDCPIQEDVSDVFARLCVQFPEAAAFAITEGTRTLLIPAATDERLIPLPEVGKGRRPLPRQVGITLQTWNPVHGCYYVSEDGELSQIAGPSVRLDLDQGATVVRPEVGRMQLALSGVVPVGAKPTDLCVMTYNVMVEAWQDDPEGKRGKWTKVCRITDKKTNTTVTPCLNNIVSVVMEAIGAGVHIVCLQESGRPVERAVRLAMPYTVMIESSAIHTPDFSIINTLVFDPGRLELLHTEPIQWPGYSIVQFACFRCRLQGRVVAVLNVHRSHGTATTAAVLTEIRAIRRNIELTNPSASSWPLDVTTLWVVCGDFNRPLDEPDGDSMRVANPNTLLTCCRNDATSVGDQDFIAQGAYDNILVEDVFGERFLEVDSPAGGNYGSMILKRTERLIPASSDHLPVAARITSDYTPQRASERLAAAKRDRGDNDDSESDEAPPWKQPRV